MLETGLGDYKFGAKNNWRRWAWNSLSEYFPQHNEVLETSCPPDVLAKHPNATVHEYTIQKKKNSIILYLPGPTDLDRLVCKQKGFNTKTNLIAVDRNLKAVKSIRKAGNFAIHGNIDQVLFAWTSEPKIGGVIMDLCHGLSSSIHPITLGLLNCTQLSNPTPVLINLMRGRDRVATKVQEALSVKEKHRGKLFLHLLAYTQKNRLENSTLDACAEDHAMFYQYIWKTAKFFTYKSGLNTYMDSVVFHMPAIGSIFPELAAPVDDCDRRPVKRQLAAVKAHRTMRL